MNRVLRVLGALTRTEIVGPPYLFDKAVITESECMVRDPVTKGYELQTVSSWVLERTQDLFPGC